VLILTQDTAQESLALIMTVDPGKMSEVRSALLFVLGF
jgi:hypothetical protein